jgi:hypothetical protein
MHFRSIQLYGSHSFCNNRPARISEMHSQPKGLRGALLKKTAHAHRFGPDTYPMCLTHPLTVATLPRPIFDVRQKTLGKLQNQNSSHVLMSVPDK